MRESGEQATVSHNTISDPSRASTRRSRSLTPQQHFSFQNAGTKATESQVAIGYDTLDIGEHRRYRHRACGLPVCGGEPQRRDRFLVGPAVRDEVLGSTSGSVSYNNENVLTG
jgi:hypothetical protein